MSLYLSSQDISQIMGVSLRQAQYVMKALEMQGKTIKHRVYYRHFSEWLSRQDGADQDALCKDILEITKRKSK